MIEQGSPIRSSRPEKFCKKGAPENFAKFTGKHLCPSFFFKFSKVAGTLLKMSLCFPVNFAKFLRSLFFNRTPLVAASGVRSL